MVRSNKKHSDSLCHNFVNTNFSRVNNVLSSLPLWNAVAHNIVGVMLFLTFVVMTYLSFRAAMNISSFINLCKPKIVILLTITALVGMLLSIEFYSNISSSLLSLIGFAFLAASSAALNQIFDRESDKIWIEQKATLGIWRVIFDKCANIYSNSLICRVISTSLFFKYFDAFNHNIWLYIL